MSNQPIRPARAGLVLDLLVGAALIVGIMIAVSAAIAVVVFVILAIAHALTG